MQALPAGAGAPPDIRLLPAVQRLIAAGSAVYANTPATVALCNEFGLAAEDAQADLPLAALSWQGHGRQPATDCWLFADPVHLVLQRDYLSLSAPAPLAVSPSHFGQLLAELNRYFAADGLEFVLDDAVPPRCYVHLAHKPDMHTSLPEQVAGRDIRPYLPHGPDAAKWRQRMNAIQMLLHEHAINQQREAAGELALNSLWFSGSGVFPPVVSGGSPASTQLLFSDLPLVRGLAQAADVACHAVPEDAKALLTMDAEKVLLVLADTGELERRWLLPLTAALRRRRLSGLQLHIAMPDQLLSVKMRWFDLYKFWRMARANSQASPP